jgi:hypothetical protein
VLKFEGWTSITIASLFVDFIDKDDRFTLIEKQKIFSSKKVSWEWFYTKWTIVKLKLKHNQLGSLSL